MKLNTRDILQMFEQAAKLGDKAALKRYCKRLAELEAFTIPTYCKFCE
jgi:hypothetical protein